MKSPLSNCVQLLERSFHANRQVFRPMGKGLSNQFDFGKVSFHSSHFEKSLKHSSELAVEISFRRTLESNNPSSSWTLIYYNRVAIRKITQTEPSWRKGGIFFRQVNLGLLIQTVQDAKDPRQVGNGKTQGCYAILCEVRQPIEVLNCQGHFPGCRVVVVYRLNDLPEIFSGGKTILTLYVQHSRAWSLLANNIGVRPFVAIGDVYPWHNRSLALGIPLVEEVPC
jgi:hypothetical protein